MSSEARISMDSADTTRIAIVPRFPNCAAQRQHALLDVQRGTDSLHRQTQLHQRDGHRGLHPHNHRLGIQKMRHGGDGGQHSSDKGIDDFQRGNIDQHAVRPMFDNLRRQIVLESERQPVVRIHLNGDEQKLAHLQDWYPLHGHLDTELLGAASWRTTLWPLRRKATSNASASVALVVTSERSTPRWMMVWAICGRMPLIRQSAPIKRAAATVLSRCWATSVSTTGTPVMSMMA